NAPGVLAARGGARVFRQTNGVGFQDYGLTDRHGNRLGGFKTGTPKDAIAGGLLFAGNPDQVFEQIVDFYEAVGGFGHLQMMAQAGPMSHEDTVGSLKLFAKEVMPRLNEYY